MKIKNRADGPTVTHYHLYAGIEDLILTSNKTEASIGFFNGSYQEFDLGSDFPYGMTFDFQRKYMGGL